MKCIDCGRTLLFGNHHAWCCWLHYVQFIGGLYIVCRDKGVKYAVGVDILNRGVKFDHIEDLVCE